MNIYLVSTPGVDSSIFESTFKLLKSVPGPLKFKSLNKIDLSYIREINPDLEYSKFQITFFELEEIANKLRNKNNLSSNDIIVILTELKLDFTFISNKDWFGYFNEKNVFVRTYGWEDYSKNKPQITIAHQVIENIFQSLSGYKFERLTGYHKRAIGCINDFCHNDYDIELKLRSAYICRQCIEVAVKNNVGIDVLNQIKRFISFFRDDLLDYESIIELIGIPELKIDANGDIFIGGKEIPMDQINKTLYIFSIIRRGDKISSRYLKESFQVLEKLYFGIKKNAMTNKAVYRLVGKVPVDLDNEIYEDIENEKMKKYIKDKRNEIKTELKQAIGEEMAEIFKIGSVKCNESYHFESCSIFPENEQLKIHIDEKLVHIVNY